MAIFRALLVLFALSVAFPARAQEPAAEVQEEARLRLREGVKAYENKRYKDAVDAFLAANRLVPNPGLSFNTAKAYEKLGDSAGALSFYRDYLRRAPDASDRPEVERKIRSFEQRLRDKGIQQLTILSRPERATVAVDGQPVGVTPWTGELEPGGHELSVKMDGYRPETRTIELSKDHAQDIEVELEAEPVAETPSAEPASDRSPKREEAPRAAIDAGAKAPRHVSLPTWIAFGVGAAALATATGFELARRSAESDAESEPTQLGAIDRYDAMEDRKHAARVCAGIGGAALLTGAVLLYLDLSSGTVKTAGRASAARFRVGYAPAPAAIFATGSF